MLHILVVILIKVMYTNENEGNKCCEGREQRALGNLHVLSA